MCPYHPARMHGKQLCPSFTKVGHNAVVGIRSLDPLLSCNEHSHCVKLHAQRRPPFFTNFRKICLISGSKSNNLVKKLHLCVLLINAAPTIKRYMKNEPATSRTFCVNLSDDYSFYLPNLSHPPHVLLWYRLYKLLISHFCIFSRVSVSRTNYCVYDPS